MAISKLLKALILICLSFIYVLGEKDEEISNDLYKIEGKVFPPEQSDVDELSNTRVLVNGGEYLAFLREDGGFLINNVKSGSYVIEIVNPNYVYEPARVDVNSKGKLRARKVNYIQTSQVVQIAYPLKFKPRGAYRYFQAREQWRITDFLFNPMILMMILPLILIMVLPTVLNAAAPETQREMQRSLNMPRYDMPDLSEMITSFFTGGKKPQPKTNKVSKKKQ